MNSKWLALLALICGLFGGGALVYSIAKKATPVHSESHKRAATTPLVCPEDVWNSTPQCMMVELSPAFKETLNWKTIGLVEELYGEDGVVCFIQYVYKAGLDAQKNEKLTPEIQHLFENVKQYLTEKGVL